MHDRIAQQWLVGEWDACVALGIDRDELRELRRAGEIPFRRLESGVFVYDLADERLRRDGRLPFARPTEDLPQLVDAVDAAFMLGIGLRTLQRWALAGAIPSLRIGRRRLYSVESVRGWIREREREELAHLVAAGRRADAARVRARLSRRSRLGLSPETIALASLAQTVAASLADP